MTASPKPRRRSRPPEPQWFSHKEGLSKALLASSLGIINQFTLHKATRRNKLLQSVLTAYSSQAFSACCRTAALNRQTKSEFAGVKCARKQNADFNASRVIQQRIMRQSQD